jgi:hypothetical protein
MLTKSHDVDDGLYVWVVREQFKSDTAVSRSEPTRKQGADFWY